MLPFEYHNEATKILKTLKRTDSVVINQKRNTVSLGSYHCTIPLNELLLLTFVKGTSQFENNNEDIRQWYYMLVELGLSHLIRNALLVHYKFFYIGP